MKGAELAKLSEPDTLSESPQLVINRVGVEKLRFSQDTENLGGRKCLGKPRKSFGGHPDAILFCRISREGVFQQPLAITLIDGVVPR